jgi:small subunit ribosomal protein S13
LPDESEDTQEAEKPEKTPKSEKDKKEDKKKAQPAKKIESKKTESENFRYIVRLANADIDGHRTIEYGLTGIKGIGIRTSTIIAKRLSLPLHKKIGDLTEEELQKLQEVVTDVADVLPTWMCNRTKDIDSGEDLHVVSTDLDIFLQEDIGRMKKIRSYKGIRHEQGKKVRGQRTSSNGRKGATIGVIRKTVAQAGAAAPAAEDKKK